MRLVPWLVPVMGLVALPSLAAQAPAVGTVGEIRVLGSRAGCRGAVPSANTPAVVVTRRNGPVQQLVDGSAAAVMIGDAYRVAKTADVRLRIATMGSGALILAPQLLCPLWDADRTIPYHGTPETGAYGIRTDSGRLTLVVSTGGAFIQWNGEGHQLLVLVGSQRVLVTGTELAIAAESDGRALVYVREGVVHLLDAGGLAVSAGQIYELSPGAPPRQLDAGSAQLARAAAADLDDHRSIFDDASRRPAGRAGKSLWRSPWPYVGVGLVGAGTYCLGVSDTRCGTHHRSHSAAVVVHIPL